MATLVVSETVSYVDDAQALNKAVHGWGTKEKVIISILAHRNAAQRKQIRQTYADLFQEDLVKRLESELKGDFERAVYRWLLDPEDRDAVLANAAVRKSSDCHVIVEIACILSGEELLAVKRAYRARYKHSLEEDVAAHTSGDTRKLLLGLVTAFRYEGDEINERLVNSEADILHDAIKAKAFNHEEVIRILTTRRKTQLVATFNRYKHIHGTAFAKVFLDEPVDELKTLLRTAVRCISNHKKYYAKVLGDAIKRVGTGEDALTRLIVSRAEKDLNDIKELYCKRNGVSLDDAVAKDTSGDYKAFLLVLLGKEG